MISGQADFIWQAVYRLTPRELLLYLSIVIRNEFKLLDIQRRTQRIVLTVVTHWRTYYAWTRDEWMLASQSDKYAYWPAASIQDEIHW